MRTVLVCQCGQSFETTSKRLAGGRGRYCSRACMYRFRVRPTGLKYNIVADNPSWFQPGYQALSGADAPAWKGDDVSYHELHVWVRRVKGTPTQCEWCGTNGYAEWANISHKYRRDPDDFVALCKMCHRHFDSGVNWGLATAKYGALGLRGTRQ